MSSDLLYYHEQTLDERRTWLSVILTKPTNVNELWHFPRRFKNKPDKQRRRIAVESFEAQILYPKNYEQIDKMYGVHSLSFKVSDERFLG